MVKSDIHIKDIYICKVCGNSPAHPDTGMCPECDPDWPSGRGKDEDGYYDEDYGYE